VAILQGLIGAVAASLALAVPPAAPAVSPALVGGAGALSAGVIALIGTAFGDVYAEAGVRPTDFSILSLSDAKGAIKNVMLTGLDLAHNATFSNGLAGTYKGPQVSF
jgi:hypothetical protein